MSEMQLDVNTVINSLSRQIAEQSQKIAILEATVEALNMYNKEEESDNS